MEETEENIIQKILKGGRTYGITDNYPKRKLWEEIANDLDGEFKVSFTAAHDVEIHNITLPYKEWKISISVSDTRPLKFNITFKSNQNFELSVSRADWVERVIRKFSKHRIKVGWGKFDNHYLIKSNRSDLVNKVITLKMQESLLKHNIYTISFQTNTDSKTSELTSIIQRRVGEKDDTLDLINMYKALIDNLKEAQVIK